MKEREEHYQLFLLLGLILLFVALAMRESCSPAVKEDAI